MRFFRCPLCAEPREVRLDRNHKPYLICDPCGTQLFVRRKEGIERLEALIELKKVTNESGSS